MEIMVNDFSAHVSRGCVLCQSSFKAFMTELLTLMPSIRKPSVAVELMVSLHCMQRGLVTAFWSFSFAVGASGSTSIIFWYMSALKLGFFLAFVNSSSRYVLQEGRKNYQLAQFLSFNLLLVLHHQSYSVEICSAY